jgi:hypothetical protein
MQHEHKMGKIDSEELLAELGLGGLSAEEKEKLIAGLSSRFQAVAFKTALTLMPPDRQAEDLKAAGAGEVDEKKIMELAAQVPGLAEAIETAWLLELESLKRDMK